MNECNFDCFNCEYDDCISDSTLNPIKIDDKKDPKQHKREYYLQNREKRIEYASNYYYRKKEEILRRKKEKYHEIHSKQ